VTDAVHDHAAGRAPGPASSANLALRFLFELGALAALAFWGVHAGQSLLGDLALGLGAPLLAAAVWGAFAAPKSARRLHGAGLVAVQLGVLGAGAIALAGAGHPLPGAVFAALVVVNTVLLHLGQGEPTP
jgi:Protein of unknown function (DUF2568)